MEEEDSTPLPQQSLFSSDSEADNSILPLSNAETLNPKHEHHRRPICQSFCHRPLSTCICPFLPSPPIPTSTTLLILQHPNEPKSNKLATLPALSLSLTHCHSILARRLHQSSSPLLDRLSQSPSPSSPVLFLFPSFNSSTRVLDIQRWAAATPIAARAKPVVIVFDATWGYAKEMVAASVPFLSGFATQVQIGDGCDARVEGLSGFESGLVLRKEPWKGCVSTMEAVARALRVLEPEGKGEEVEERLLNVLRAMVGFQACFLKMVRRRRKVGKKGRVFGSCAEGV